MGWFFGCFGGNSKKGHKHRTPSSPLPKQQKPLYVTPVHVPAAVSSSIPIKPVPGQEKPSHEDLFTVRQVSSSAPARHIQEPFLQTAVASSQMPEKQQKPGPWYQLDDLEEELEDLRKQILKESQDTKKIKEEVSSIKSCGTIKTAFELKSPQKVDHRQGSMPEGRLHTWLAPSASPNTRISPVKNFALEGLKAALCEPTPTKECHSLLFGVQTPLSSTKMMQGTDHQSMREQVYEEQLNQMKNEDVPDTDHVSLPHKDGIKCKLPSDVKPSQKNPSTSSPCLDNEGIIKTEKHFDKMSDGSIRKPKSILKQGSRFLYGTENTACKDDVENENISTKKRRLAVNMAPVQSQCDLEKQLVNDVSNVQDYDALCQKRLKVVSPEEKSRREINSSLHADPVPIHFFRCDSLSPIMESGTSIDDSTSYDNTGISQGSMHQLHSYNSINSTSQISSHSPSFRQSPASQTKSVTFASTNDEDYTTDELSYNHGAIEKYSEGSYTNSTCFNDTNDEDEEDVLPTASYSSSIDSEETLSDLSPEHCFSPLISPSHAQSSTVYRSQDNSTSTHEKRAAKSHSISSTQYSSVYQGRKQQHVSRYDGEEDDVTEDDYDLFTDAMSHVSTECSEREQRRSHSHTDSMDSVSAHFARLGCVADSNSIDTPRKLSECIRTPNVDIPGRAGQHTSRLRSKPASSVLTPVENVSQWKQLKERDHKLDVIAKAGSDDWSKTDPSKHAKQSEDSRIHVCDENRNSVWTPSNKSVSKQLASHVVPMSINAHWSHWGPTSDAEPVNVNVSLSHWGIASKADSIHVDTSPTTTLETETVRVDMSLSHWLKSSSKHNEAPKASGTCTTSSSSGENAVISPAPRQQTKNYVSPNSATQTVQSQFTSYVASDRPILGAVGEECPSTRAKQRSPWDGKGTPNSTAKYMEDRRVKWHSTPFEQRLEKALDKQGILLQKKLFAATQAGSPLN